MTKNAHIPSLTCSICDTEVVELDEMPWCPTCLLWVVPLSYAPTPVVIPPPLGHIFTEDSMTTTDSPAGQTRPDAHVPRAGGAQTEPAAAEADPPPERAPRRPVHTLDDPTLA